MTAKEFLDEGMVKRFWTQILATVVSAIVIGGGGWMIHMDYRQARSMAELKEAVMVQIQANSQQIAIIRENAFTKDAGGALSEKIARELNEMRSTNEAFRETVRSMQRDQDKAIMEMRERIIGVEGAHNAQ